MTVYVCEIHPMFPQFVELPQQQVHVTFFCMTLLVSGNAVEEF